MQEHRAAICRAARDAAALVADETGDALRVAEEGVDLVDEVGSEVVDGAIAGCGFEFPAVSGWVGAVAVEMRFELRDVAQRTGGDDLLERHEVGVPAAILVDGEFLAGFLLDLHEFFGFSGGGDEGLFDDDVLACFQGGFAHVEVCFGDAGDDDEVDIFIGEGFVDAAVGFGAWVVLLGVVGGFGRALDDAVEFVDVWEGQDEWYVEDFGAERFRQVL